MRIDEVESVRCDRTPGDDDFDCQVQTRMGDVELEEVGRIDFWGARNVETCVSEAENERQTAYYKGEFGTCSFDEHRNGNTLTCDVESDNEWMFRE